MPTIRYVHCSSCQVNLTRDNASQHRNHYLAEYTHSSTSRRRTRTTQQSQQNPPEEYSSDDSEESDETTQTGSSAAPASSAYNAPTPGSFHAVTPGSYYAPSTASYAPRGGYNPSSTGYDAPTPGGYNTPSAYDTPYASATPSAYGRDQGQTPRGGHFSPMYSATPAPNAPIWNVDGPPGQQGMTATSPASSSTSWFQSQNYNVNASFSPAYPAPPSVQSSTSSRAQQYTYGQYYGGNAGSQPPNNGSPLSSFASDWDMPGDDSDYERR